ncbi:hypothetical protein Tco_1383354, partial [Tanacetum coccineum]
KEFYPRFLTTIAGRRWIISRGFRLAVMKCLQSPKYVVALGTAIGLAIDKGMQTGLVAGIDHEKAGRGLAEVAAYDLFMEERYVSAVLALRGLDFNFLSQLESQKDARIDDILDSLCLEGPFAETPEVKEGALSHRLSLSEAMGPLVDPLSSKNLVGEASTSEYQQPSPPLQLCPFQSPLLMLRTFQVRGRSFPLRSLSLYAPLPSASVTSYSPSYLGPSFPPSSAWVASLLRYTISPGLKLVLRTLELLYFSIFALLLALQIAACSIFSSKIVPLLLLPKFYFLFPPSCWLADADRGKALSDIQLFIPIFEWVISKLLSIVRYYFPWTPSITAYRLNLSRTTLAFLLSAGSVSSVSVHGSGSSSSTSMGAARESSFGRSIIKSAKICPLTDILGLYCMSYSLSFMLHFCNLPAMLDWLVFSIWKAFGGNTRDLGSFGEETDKTTNLHQHLLRISTQKLETASQITRDAVTTHLKTASQDFQMASDCMTHPII